MNKYKRSVVLQQDAKDCGCACLKTLVRYYGGDVNLEYLRELSGTTALEGTSILGLIQASEKIGLKGVAYQLSIEELKKQEKPCILHVEKAEGNHYITCFTFRNNFFLIGDPAIGYCKYTEEELLKIWKKKYAILFEKREKLNVKKKSHFIWLWKVIKKDSSFFIVAVFLGIIISFLSMSTLVFTEKLVDVILPAKNKILLYKSLAMWAFLLLSIIGLNYIRTIVLIKQAYRFNIRIIGYFFEKLLFMPKSFFDSKKQGDMIARMNDTERLQENIRTVIADSLVEVAVLFSAFAFTAYYSWQVATLILVVSPVIYLCVYIYNTHIKNTQRNAMVNYAKTEANYIDTINGIATIKVFTKEKIFSEKNISIYTKYQMKLFELQQLEINQMMVVKFSGTLIAICGTSYAIVQMFNNVIELGDLIAITSLIFILIDSINGIAQLNFDFYESKIALERIFDFVERSEALEKDTKNIDSENKNIDSILIKGAYFAFPGQDYLIKNSFLELKKGSLTALVGQNGSGKSTILQILLKFYNLEKGQILINREDNFNNFNTSHWRKIIANVPQNIKIFNDDLLYNLSLDKDIPETVIVNFCKEFGFDKYFKRFKNNYRTLLGEEGINVSGGEKQLIALARVLFKKPKILLLDEPTASMDIETEKFVLAIIAKIKKNTIILFVTHKKEMIKSVADNIYKLENKVIEKCS